MPSTEEPQQEDDKILDLDELTEPVGVFRLNGVVYTFVQMGSLGLLEQKKIERLWSQIQDIRKLTNPKKTQEETYIRAMHQIMPKISNMSKEVAEKSEISKLLQAVIVFFSYRTASQVALVVRMAQISGSLDQPIGENSSLDSIVSGLKATPSSG